MASHPSLYGIILIYFKSFFNFFKFLFFEIFQDTLTFYINQPLILNVRLAKVNKNINFLNILSHQQTFLKSKCVSDRRYIQQPCPDTRNNKYVVIDKAGVRILKPPVTASWR